MCKSLAHFYFLVSTYAFSFTSRAPSRKLAMYLQYMFQVAYNNVKWTEVTICTLYNNFQIKAHIWHAGAVHATAAWVKPCPYDVTFSVSLVKIHCSFSTEGVYCTQASLLYDVLILYLSLGVYKLSVMYILYIVHTNIREQPSYPTRWW